MRKLNLAAFLLFFVFSGYSQERKNNFPEIKLSMSSYHSSGEDLPFWMTSNQNGVFTTKNSNYQLIQLGFQKELKQDSLKKWGIFYGSDLVYSYAGTTDLQVNQYWLGGRYKWLILKAGAQADPVLYSGLSSTNGNMDWSNNARPLPGISLSTNNYIPFLFWKKWFSFKAFYSENMLFDKQYVENTHLHHKYLIGRASFNTWKFSLGLDHWVYWGGLSPDYGKLPGLSDYFRYLVGLKGSAASPLNEKTNASGNSLGLYLLTVEKDYADCRFTFYYNHPFEDRSGLEMDNIPDGLWGLNYNSFKEKALITGIVYEFQNTTNQSGTYNMIPVGNTGGKTGRGNDDYFNNWVYKSGHVHYNRMMGTPVFIPVIGANGISKGFDNNRIRLHHIGLSGWTSERVSWKSLLTWSRSYGTYAPKGIFPSPLDELSFLGELSYFHKTLPLKFNIGIAGDYGERFQKRIGGYAGVSWSIK